MHSTAEGGSDETSTEIHAINPSDLPLTRDTRMERESSGFPSGFTPRHYWQRMPRRGQVLRTLTQDYIFDISRTSYNKSTHNLRRRVAPPPKPRGQRCSHDQPRPSGRRLPPLPGRGARPIAAAPACGWTTRGGRSPGSALPENGAPARALVLPVLEEPELQRRRYDTAGTAADGARG